MEKTEKTPNSGKKCSKFRKNLEIKSEQENIYDSEDRHSPDEKRDACGGRRPMKSRKNLVLGVSRDYYPGTCNHDVLYYKPNVSHDSQDESHEGKKKKILQQCLLDMYELDDEMEDDAQKVDTSLKSENETEKEVHNNLLDKCYSTVQPYQEQGFQTLPVTPVRVTRNDKDTEFSPTLQYEDEELTYTSLSTPILPVTPHDRPLSDERCNESDAILEAETEEPTSTDVHQLLGTPVSNFQSSEKVNQDKSSPFSQDQEPDTTYQLPSTPVSRPSQCLPLKKRRVCIGTQDENQNESQNQPLAQPIIWDSSPITSPSGVHNVCEEIDNSDQWKVSCSEQSFSMNFANGLETAANKLKATPSNSSNLNDGLIERQFYDALPKPNFEMEEDQHTVGANIPNATECNWNISFGNENRASVLRHVGRINYCVNDPLKPNFSIHKIEVPEISEDIVLFKEKSQQSISNNYPVDEQENQAVMALLDLGTRKQNSEASQEKAIVGSCLKNVSTYGSTYTQTPV